MQWNSGRQDPAARFVVLLRRSYGAQGGRRTTGGGEIVAAQRLTGGDVERNSGVMAAETEEKRSREGSWA